MAFKIALTNVPFDLDYEETIRFESRNKQYSYFHIPEIFNDCPDVNFHINDGLSAEAIFVDETNALMSSLNRNYAIIQDNYNNTTKYLFYFIKRVTHESSRKQYKLELYLDVINTYYLDCTFDDCLIERAHLKRFAVSPASVPPINVYGFDYNKDSKLFKNEGIAPSLNINKWNKKLGFAIDGERNSLSADKDKWALDNIDYYTYYYIRCSDIKSYFINGDDSVLPLKANGLTAFTSGYLPVWIFVAPHYKSNKYAYVKSTKTENNETRTYYQVWNESAIINFIRNNNIDANVICIKKSFISPFYNCGEYAYHIDEVNSSGHLILSMPVVHYPEYNDGFLLQSSTAGTQCFFLLRQAYVKPIRLYGENYSSLYETGIEIYSAGNIRYKYYEPKENILCKRWRINVFGKIRDIDLSTLNTDNVILYYYETLTPDISKIMVEVYPTNLIEPQFTRVYNNYKLYSELYLEQDMTTMFGYSQLSEYLQNNKNFFQQANLGIALPVVKNLLVDSPARFFNMAGSTNGKDYAENMINLFHGFTEGLYDFTANSLQTALSIDNLMSRPTAINNVNGNIGMNIGYNDMKIYLSEVETLDADKKVIFDYFKIFGYKYGELDNIKNIDNIRYYFNFVKAPIRCVHLANNYMSNIVREKLKDIFRKGIIFYNYKAMEEQNVSAFDYTVNNYENEVAENA